MIIFFTSCGYKNEIWSEINNLEFETNELEIIEEQDWIIEEIQKEIENITKNTTKDIYNINYIINWEEILLQEGKYSENIPNSSAKNTVNIFTIYTGADLNNDAENDTIVLLSQSLWGTGIFYYVAVVESGIHEWQSSNTIFIWDRISPNNIEYIDEKIIINYTKRYPWEWFTETTSVWASKILSFENNELKEFPFEKLTQQTAEKLAQDKWGYNFESNVENITVHILDGQDQIWYVEMIEEWLKDDSVDSIKKIMKVHFVNGEWKIWAELLTQFTCKEWRGQQEFAESFCL